MIPSVAAEISQLPGLKGRGRAGAEASATLAEAVAARGNAVSEELVSYAVSQAVPEQQVMEALANIPHYMAELIETCTRDAQLERAQADALRIVGGRRPESLKASPAGSASNHGVTKGSVSPFSSM